MQLKKPALEGDNLFGPQPLDQLQRLQHARHPLLPGHAEAFVLDLAVADADAEHDAALRHDIEAGNVFGDLNRVEQRQQQYRQAEVHRAGVGGQPRQQRHALQRLVGRRQIVMAGRDAIKPDITGETGQFRRLAEAAHRIVRPGVLRHQEHAEFHEDLPKAFSAPWGRKGLR